jgi:hypothetical protein
MKRTEQTLYKSLMIPIESSKKVNNCNSKVGKTDINQIKKHDTLPNVQQKSLG